MRITICRWLYINGVVRILPKEHHAKVQTADGITCSIMHINLTKLPKQVVSTKPRYKDGP